MLEDFNHSFKRYKLLNFKIEAEILGIFKRSYKERREKKIKKQDLI